MPTKKDVTDAIMYNTPIISDMRYLADGFTYVFDAAGNIILTKSPKKTV